MTQHEFLDFLTVAERLKGVPRHCYTADGTREVVAGHCWRLALMAMLLQPELPEIDGGVQSKTWMKDLERRTRESLGRKVKITQNEKKKSIELFYDDDQDMEALLTLLCGKSFFDDEQ